MRKSLSIVRADIIRPLFTASFALAMALTIGCSSDDSGGGGEQSYNYCITADNSCLTGPFTASTCNGQLSNSCPNNPNQNGGSSSSNPGGGTSSSSEVGTFTDNRDNKSYKWVKINTQTWMAENLNYTTSGSKCGNGSTLSDANTATCDTYGRLYSWETANSVCPTGWHLPSDAEWNTLMKFVNPSCSDNSHCNGAGTKLKATSDLWRSNGGGTDDYGFAALPGGYGDSYDGSFGSGGKSGDWWSASEADALGAYHRGMSFALDEVGYFDSSKSNLFSVRCLKNE